jgi:hypothetical protein
MEVSRNQDEMALRMAMANLEDLAETFRKPRQGEE